LEKQFYEKAREGTVLGVPELRRFAKAENISGVTNEYLESLKSLWEVTSVHSEKRSGGGFAGSLLPKLGCIFVDLAEYKKNLRVANKQRCYFLVGCDALSELLCCLPLTNKTQQAWEAGVKHMVENVYPVVTTIVSDRDSSVAGKIFQEKMKRELGIDWYHLRVNSKSYKSEILIRYLKRKFSVGLGLNKKGDNGWLKFVDPVVAEYNSRNVKGTKLRRDEIGKHNVMELLAQKYKTPDFSVYFNNSVVSNFSAKMRRGLGFRFSPGQKVLLSRTATYESGEGKSKGAFDKPSVEGTFGRKVYEIESAVLRTNEMFYYKMCYYLKNLEGIYYQNQLQSASFADRKKRPWEEGVDAVRDQADQAKRVKSQAVARRSKRRE
jgi:hypothetical protein